MKDKKKYTKKEELISMIKERLKLLAEIKEINKKDKVSTKDMRKIKILYGVE